MFIALFKFVGRGLECVPANFLNFKIMVNIGFVKSDNLMMDQARYGIDWMFISVCNSKNGRYILYDALRRARSANYEAMLLICEELPRSISGYIYIFTDADQYDRFIRETDYKEYKF